MPVIRPVVLSGGSGTRLWPLSTAGTPKQFAELLGGRTLFAMTVDRLNGMEGVAAPIVVAGASHLDLIDEALAETPPFAVVVEPVGRNTAPAAVSAALVAHDDDVLVILPSDHLISDIVGFRRAVHVATERATAGGVVTFGIEPSRPETGYGYIELGGREQDLFHVASFREKPDWETAIQIFESGHHLWNSGIFVVRADHLIDQAGEHVPDLLAGVRQALPVESGDRVFLGAEFADVEAISFDHAIMERTTQALVLPIDVGWDDIGSYRSLLEASARDRNGNHLAGQVLVEDVSGSYIKATSRKVVVSGMSDVVVVETPDAVLVIPLDRAQDVRTLARHAEEL